jgi:uncharacterized protein
MQMIKQWSLVMLATVVIAAPVEAVQLESVPNPRQAYGGWVTDMANVLSPATEGELNQLIRDLEAQNGSEIAVVTVPETKPVETPKVFATQLFNRWGIGKKGQDNGVLFLISIADRRVEIETGRGLQQILPDTKVSSIIQEQITPQFKQQNFDAGTLAGTKALIIALGGEVPVSEWQLLLQAGGVLLIVLGFGAALVVDFGKQLWASLGIGGLLIFGCSWLSPDKIVSALPFVALMALPFVDWSSSHYREDSDNDNRSSSDSGGSSSDFGGGGSDGGGSGGDW